MINTNRIETEGPKQNIMIARFGEAKLIRQAEGTYRLDGGSRSDRIEAQEWSSLFLHEAVFGAT